MDVELLRDLGTLRVSEETLKDAFVDAAFGLPGGMGFAESLGREVGGFGVTGDVGVGNGAAEGVGKVFDRCVGIAGGEYVGGVLREVEARFLRVLTRMVS